ncbi:MAG TPA: ProQ/FinO family protein [Herbaspirillum sp.]
MQSMTKPNPTSNTIDSGVALAEAPTAVSVNVSAHVAVAPSEPAVQAAPTGETPAQLARALLKRLQTQFPAFRDCLPLAIGIDKQLIAELPDVSRKVLRIALGIHTNSLRYLRVMEKATHRFDLAGKQADEVTDVHRTHASEILRERFKKDAEQRKAQKAAADAEKAAADAARIHAEKLALLSEKFSRKK